jgi:hypothetical protein
MKRFIVLIKNGPCVLHRFEAMSTGRFACVLAHMDTADLLGGYAVAYPVEGA